MQSLKKFFHKELMLLLAFLMGLAILLTGFQSTTAPVHPLNEIVNYSAATKNNKYLVPGGWSGLEQNGVWTETTEASLSFRAHSTKQLELDMQYHAFLTLKHDTLKIEVWVNGKQQADWIINNSSPQPHKVMLAPRAPKDNYVVTFKILNPSSPYAQKLNADKRLLGIFLESTQIKAS